MVAGCFAYMGIGLGYYYSTDGSKYWLWRTEAEARATVEGVDFQFVDKCKD